jgi:hypothetical protein
MLPTLTLAIRCASCVGENEKAEHDARPFHRYRSSCQANKGANAKVQADMAAQDWARAFSIASKFARLGPQRAAILRAQAARLSPGLYRQMGCDPAAIIEAGKAAMRARFEAR